MGFTFRITKKGDIFIYRNGEIVTTLRGNRAREFKESIDSLTEDEIQLLMARLTGNYKRGNERLAKEHPRN